jgi:RNA polymerase sigma factor (sigma-70 family)
MTPPRDDDGFQDFWQRLSAGEQSAQVELFNRFQSQLLRKAHEHLHSHVRSIVGVDDILQTALASFFSGQAKGEFVIPSWNSLWSLLALITVRKCYRYNKKFRREGRHATSNEPRSYGFPWDTPTAEATSDQAAMYAEILENLLRGLKDERSRQVVSLWLQGYTEVESAEQVGCSQRTVRRMRRSARDRLEALLTADCASPP